MKQKIHLQIKPRGLCCTCLTQNDPGMWDSSVLHSMAIFVSLSNLLYAPQTSAPFGSVSELHW